MKNKLFKKFKTKISDQTGTTPACQTKNKNLSKNQAKTSQP